MRDYQCVQCQVRFSQHERVIDHNFKWPPTHILKTKDGLECIMKEAPPPENATILRRAFRERAVIRRDDFYRMDIAERYGPGRFDPITNAGVHDRVIYREYRRISTLRGMPVFTEI